MATTATSVPQYSLNCQPQLYSRLNLESLKIILNCAHIFSSRLSLKTQTHDA